MDKNGRPNSIEDALIKIHGGCWFTWKDSKNKVYSNLLLSKKVGINGNVIDNPHTLPSEETINEKLKELQDAWDAANGG